MAEDRFYIVWGEQSKTPPTVKQQTRSAAVAEANRLATRNRGRFYVLEAISVAEKVDVIHTELDDIPF